MSKVWIVSGYDTRKDCDILEYYEDGVLQFTFNGYRDDRSGSWRVYPRSRGTYCYKKPNVSILYYHEAKRA